jgi:hypothetical protein
VVDWLCFAKPILCDGMALLRKAIPSWWIGFASQSQSFARDWLCFAKPFRRGWFAFRHKANPLWSSMTTLTKEKCQV